MCVSPIKIKNPREFKRPHFDSSYISVPCGECEECRQQKINDWFVRLNYDYLASKKNGGCWYFLTLTYNDSMVPRVCEKDFSDLCEAFDIDVPYFSGMCFNKRHVVQFFKDFRDFFREKFGISGIKHFTVCEFGSDADKTHRPHYHTVLSFPAFVNESVVRSVANYCWSERVKTEFVPEHIVRQSELPAVKERWSHGQYNVLQEWIIAPPSSSRHKKPMFKRRYGFTSWSSHYGAQVQSSACLRYILKYLFKDKNFASTDVCNGLDYILRRCPTLETLELLYPPVDPLGCPDRLYEKQLDKGHDFFKTNPDFKRYHKLIQSVRDCMPFHVQSIKIGESLFREIVDDFEHGKNLIKNNDISFPYDDFKYSVPKYILRRLFYNVEKKPQNRHYCKYRNIVFLNDLGKECLNEFLVDRLNLFVKQFAYYLSGVYVSLMSKDVVIGWYDLFGTSFNQSLAELRNLSATDIKLFYLYRLIFKDIIFFNQKSELNKLSKDEFLSFGVDMFVSKVNTSDLRELDQNYFDLLPHSVKCSEGDFVIPPYGYDGVSSFNELDIFKRFDDYILWLDKIRYAVRYYKCQSKQEKYDRSKLLRSTYNSFIHN